MQEWKMPTDISEKEKIVGGIMTAGQLLYLAIGLGITVGFGLIFVGIIGKISFIIGGLIGIPFGVVFAFVKIKKQLTVGQYIRLKISKSKQTKVLVNHRTELDNMEFNYFEKEKI